MPEFASIRNFRALHGRRVRPGVLYRSGHLGEASDADLDRLARLGIRTVIDLRSDREALAAPDRLPQGAALVRVPLPGLGIVRRIREGTAGPARAEMAARYCNMAAAFAPAWGRALAAVADSPGAVLFHCQNGKDRTGALAALLLLLAGEDDGRVMEDYLLTNEALAPFFEEDFARKSAGMDKSQKDALRAVFSAEPEYLAAFLKGIESAAETAAGYAARAGLTGEALFRLLQKITA